MNEPSAQPTPKPACGGALTRPRFSRILRPAEFRTVYDQGIRFSGPLFAAFCLARAAAGTDDGHGKTTATTEERPSARLGITVPRAVGKAVLRNRIKRRFREAFRLHRAEIAPRWDIVINPRKAAAAVPWAEVERAFRKVIEKCGT